MNILKLLTALFFAVTLSACAGSPTPSASAQVVSEPNKRWIGVMAVKESPQVNLVIAQSGNDPKVYYPKLRALLDAGAIQPAPGNYAFVPYAGGQPYEQPERFSTTTGVYTMWVPAKMVTPGRAMCVQVPSSWPAIAGQRRFPSNGGKSVNCFDFGPNAVGNYASTKHTASMIVIVEPAG